VPGITALSYTPTTPLANNMTYYWRVAAVNLCGSGSYSAVRSFVTQPLPGDCPAGSDSVVIYQTDFESGADGFVDASLGSYHWVLSTNRSHSAGNSFRGVDVAAISDQWLVSPEISLPAGETNLTLSFWNYHQFEGGPSTCNDGGLLEVTTDSGVTWDQIANISMLTQPYDGTIRAGVSNPLQGKSAWCGSRSWTRAVVDLNANAGETIQLRFRLGTSVSGSADGWYIDDVKVQYCTQTIYTYYLPIIGGE
jgi:hypothetical protein